MHSFSSTHIIFDMAKRTKKTSAASKKRGRGRPPTPEPNKELIAARIPPHLVEKLDAYAELTDSSRTDALVVAIEKLKLPRK